MSVDLSLLKIWYK